MGTVIGIVVLVLIIIFAKETVSSGNKFRDASSQIVEHMYVEKVIEIMGKPSFTKQHQNGSFEFVYEKSEWKGMFRGGTQTRRLEIVFDSNGYVISVGRNENCQMSGW